MTEGGFVAIIVESGFRHILEGKETVSGHRPFAKTPLRSERGFRL